MTESDVAIKTPVKLVCVGMVLSPKGLDGAVRIKAFTTKETDIAAYGPLFDITGEKKFTISILGSTKKGIVAKLGGVDDRVASEALKGLKLYVERAAFPETREGQFYYSDLVGMDAFDLAGQKIGKVKSMNNFGAGDLMEIAMTNGESVVLSFAHDQVPVIDLENHRVTVDV